MIFNRFKIISFQGFPFCGGFNAPTVLLPEFSIKTIRLLLSFLTDGTTTVKHSEVDEFKELTKSMGLVSYL